MKFTQVAAALLATTAAIELENAPVAQSNLQQSEEEHSEDAHLA